MKNLLQLVNFSFSYTDELPLFRIENTLSLRSGELVVLTGPSGAGKSSLLAIIQGLIPTHILGRCQGRIQRENFECSYLFQNPYSQIIAPKVREEFVFNLENKRKPKSFGILVRDAAIQTPP